MIPQPRSHCLGPGLEGPWAGPWILVWSGGLGLERRERRWARGFLANPVAPNVADQAQAWGTGRGHRQGEHSNPQGRTLPAYAGVLSGEPAPSVGFDGPSRWRCRRAKAVQQGERRGEPASGQLATIDGGAASEGSLVGPLGFRRDGPLA